MRRYCHAASGRELTKYEGNGVDALPSEKPDHELQVELRQEIFGGKPLPESSANLIRDAFEIRVSAIYAARRSWHIACARRRGT